MDGNESLDDLDRCEIYDHLWLRGGKRRALEYDDLVALCKRDMPARRVRTLIDHPWFVVEYGYVRVALAAKVNLRHPAIKE